MAKYKGITGLVTEPIATVYHKVPAVSTANLPGAGINAHIPAVNGMLVYNTTLGMLQQRAGSVWSGITTAPTITSFQYSDGATATAEKTVATVISCTTQTSTTVLVPGVTSAIIVGQVVSGAGVPLGATVVSIVTDTSFVLSSAATASATINLTFGGVITITGSNFDSILSGGAANIGVTFDGTSASAISVNSLKTIITCTPPAHAAGTIILQLINASGLTAETNFTYDIEPIFTTAAGSIGGFVESTAFTTSSSPAAPRIQGSEDGVALTTGFDKVTSATDLTVITSTMGGLTLLTSGYLTGTLAAAANGTSYPFYATAKDNENQRTAPRLFNIVSYDGYASGGTTSGNPVTINSVQYNLHAFTSTGTTNFIVPFTIDMDILVVAGGGGAGWHSGGPGGAGGLIWQTGRSVTAATYVITVGAGGTSVTADGVGVVGADSSFSSLLLAKGGGYGGYHNADSGDGGSGGGGPRQRSAGDGIQTTGGQAGDSRTYGFGNDGAELSSGGLADNYPSSGAGGAGTAGFQGSQTAGGIGGTGKDMSALLGTTYGASGWFAGGGGGSLQYSIGGTYNGGAGGQGGGGAGGRTQVTGTNGTPNTGGGQGGHSYASGGGGNGGSGIVIIRYPV